MFILKFLHDYIIRDFVQGKYFLLFFLFFLGLKFSISFVFRE